MPRYWELARYSARDGLDYAHGCRFEFTSDMRKLAILPPEQVSRVISLPLRKIRRPSSSIKGQTLFRSVPTENESSLSTCTAMSLGFGDATRDSRA